MPIRLFLGVFVFGSMAMFFAYGCAYALIRWIDEIHFYWQSGWNFDLPHPAYAADKGFEPRQASNFDRILYGSPLQIIAFSSGYFTIEKLLKQAVTAPPPANLPPLRKRPAFWLAMCVFAMAIGLMIFTHFVTASMRHH